MRTIKLSTLCHPLAHLFGFRRRHRQGTRPVSEPPPASGNRPKGAQAAPRHRRARKALANENVIPLCPAAQRRERERCKAILTCDAARDWPDVAKVLAFDTLLGRREAIDVLALPVFASAGRRRGA